MPDPRLILGPIAFSGFEVPDSVGFGGAQRLVVHRLPGGARVVDAMGRDDAEIAWSGTFLGADAADRARALDVLRAEGAALTLSWDAFLYTVVIRRLDAEFRSSWQVPYRIACTVVRDEAAAVADAVVPLAASLMADLAAAAGWTDTSAATAALLLPGAATRGTAAYAAATAALGAGAAAVEAGLAAAGASLDSDDPGTALAAACGLAGFAAARGFVGRAVRELSAAST